MIKQILKTLLITTTLATSASASDDISEERKIIRDAACGILALIEVNLGHIETHDDYMKWWNRHKKNKTLNSDVIRKSLVASKSIGSIDRYISTNRTEDPESIIASFDAYYKLRDEMHRHRRLVRQHHLKSCHKDFTYGGYEK